MSHSIKLGLTVATLAALGLSAAHPAAAQTTIYNFQAANTFNTPTYTGVGVLLNGVKSTSIFNREVFDNGTTSQVGGGVGGNVLDSNGGINTNLVFKYDAPDFGSSTVGLSGSSDRILLDGFQITALSGNASFISLTGLAANTPFTAVFYAEDGTAADSRRTTFNLTDSSHVALAGASNVAIATANSGTAFTAANNALTGPGNYVTFTGTADANGGIYASYNGLLNLGTFPGDGRGVFNGVQFQVGSPAPEPSQLAGLGFTALGALGLILKSRKRSVSATPAA